MSFDMPPVSAGYPARGRWLIDHLSADLEITEAQAAGIVGNLGFESGGLVELQERSPVAGRGGRGWAQWTGPRRVAFETWCAAHRLNPDTDEANYGYVLVEMRTSYGATVAALELTTTVEAAVWSVGQTYERPGGTDETHLPGFSDRLTYAMRALAGPRVTAEAGSSINEAWLTFVAATRTLQAALTAGGWKPGPDDGLFGPRTQAALDTWKASL
jgi:hypothetical protein